jgi:hypothetical protein
VYKKHPSVCCGLKAPGVQQHRRSALAKCIFFEDQARFLKQDGTATARSLGQRADNANCFFGVLKSGDTSSGPPHMFALSEARAAHEAIEGLGGIGSIVLKA